MNERLSPLSKTTTGKNLKKHKLNVLLDSYLIVHNDISHTFIKERSQLIMYDLAASVYIIAIQFELLI